MTRTIERETPEMLYLRGEVEAANGVKMTVLLYNRLIRDLREGAAALEDDSSVDSQDVARKLRKCRDILSFFLDTIDPEEEPAERLSAIYYTAIEQILTAEMEKSGRPIQNILPSIELLRERWVELQQEEGKVKR